MAIHEQAILETVERLLMDRGRIPIVEAVSGGFFSTISPVLREWRRQRQAGSAGAGEIPARVREARGPGQGQQDQEEGRPARRVITGSM